MKVWLKAFLWSSVLHGIILISLFDLSNGVTHSKPIFIDLSYEETIDILKEESKIPSPFLRPARVMKVQNRIEPEKIIKEMVKREAETLSEHPVEGTPDEERVSHPSAQKTITDQIVAEVLTQGSSEQSNPEAKERHSDNGYGNAPLLTSMADSLERARQMYLKEHFSYIRDIINKNISYPYMARKMGWSGKVKVSFIIAEDGSVKDVKILESSGFDLLDRNAADAIKKASPFPRPPVSAEVIVPVVYRLN